MIRCLRCGVCLTRAEVEEISFECLCDNCKDEQRGWKKHDYFG